MKRLFTNDATKFLEQVTKKQGQVGTSRENKGSSRGKRDKKDQEGTNWDNKVLSYHNTILFLQLFSILIMSPFLGIFCHFVCQTESVRQRNH